MDRNHPAPTGYILQLDKNNTNNNDSPQEPKFVRKVVAPLTGSEVYLLGKAIIQKFICYTPKQTKDIENSRIGSLLGVTEDQSHSCKLGKTASLPCWRICLYRCRQKQPYLINHQKGNQLCSRCKVCHIRCFVRVWNKHPGPIKNAAQQSGVNRALARTVNKEKSNDDKQIVIVIIMVPMTIVQ